MLLQMNKPAETLIAYEADLKKHPSQFNGLHGAAVTSEAIGDVTKATRYYTQLVSVGVSQTKSRTAKGKRILAENGLAYKCR